MKENSQLLTKSPLLWVAMLSTLTVLVGNQLDNYFLYLILAQVLFVPLLAHRMHPFSVREQLIIGVGIVAITVHSLSPSDWTLQVAGGLYLFVTAIYAKSGIERFITRKTRKIEELAIDVALVYLFIGGLWFFAYSFELTTGFTPLLTWLTAIHFHYSAFLLTVSVGLMGRVYTSKWMAVILVIIMTGPMTVALGITYSRVVEIVAVSLYVCAIFALFFIMIRIQLPRLQKLVLQISIGILCFTIIWSFLYAWGRLMDITIVTIPDMLSFHGMLNCFVFGTTTLLAWYIAILPDSANQYRWPASQIRGSYNEKGEAVPGLVDHLEQFVDVQNIAPEIQDFYENTDKYKLYAFVKWKTWFMPFAFVYQFISKRIGQLNLPVGAKEIEMTGTIERVNEQHDGRSNPRVWRRSIKGEPVFVAIYSSHVTAGIHYLNIALPLPFSTMTGVLNLSTLDHQLQIASMGAEDAGVYLTVKDITWKLPLNEMFLLKKTTMGLEATHDMSIFGITFLHIDYRMVRKEDL